MTNSSRLIKDLNLLPHPEGGYYSEIYRSETNVSFNGKNRAALTTIYFLLEKEQVSRWHLVDADEAWHFYEGASLELYMMSPDFTQLQKITLGEVSANSKPVHVIPAGWWQAAKSSGEFSLCGCTVAPAFEFAGFRFLHEDEKDAVSELHPQLDYLL